MVESVVGGEVQIKRKEVRSSSVRDATRPVSRYWMDEDLAGALL